MDDDGAEIPAAGGTAGRRACPVTRRAILAAGGAAMFLGHGTMAEADPSEGDASAWLGWDELAASLGRSVQIAGFLFPPRGASKPPDAVQLVPCLPAAGLPPRQRLTLGRSGHLHREPSREIVLIGASGRVERVQDGLGIVRPSLAVLWRSAK